MYRPLALCLLSGAVALSACSDSDNDSRGIAVPKTYSFASNFVPGASSVSYTGQICRHVLITALTNAVRDASEIAGEEYRGNNIPYYDDTIAGALADQSTRQTLGLNLPVASGQETLGALCGSKHLNQKFAGNDSVTDHRDWTSEFVGVEGFSSAEAYLRSLIADASEQAATGSNAPGAPHYVSPEGLDYAQMIQKLLLMGVPFSQGTDDYLDNDVDGKGLLASAEQDDDAPYSSLEHQFDEGYGYFGAARAYADRSDADNRSGVNDDNGDGVLDITAEHNFGASTNAAKRDEGSVAEAKTDFTGDAFDNFLLGRAILNSTGLDFASLDAATRSQLLVARDAAVHAWESAIAATVVHYINDTLADLAKAGTAEFSIEDLAKHFSEMKAFALGLQFNPRSPLHDDNGNGQSLFAQLHELLRDNPPCVASVCSNEQAYRDNLLAARALLGDAYGFAQANLEAW